MFGISGFFKNIQNSFTKEVVLRTKIKETIKIHTKADIPIENISCKNGVINLKNTSSAALSVIFIKKSQILNDLKEFSDIR